ncbi:MAG: hypothetical protein ACU833_11520 [Gammaproteobacteria bacterium]
MKNLCKRLFVLSIMYSTHVPVSIADSYPTGSYRKSCSNISVLNNTLSADCRTLDGATNQTALKGLDACLNSITQDGDIGNIDGNLICLPDLPKVAPGFKFPQSETEINEWIYGNDLSSVYDHAWGVWAGLTSHVGNVNGMPVRAFETWNTVSNMLYQIESMPADKLLQLPAASRKLRLDLMLPNQFKNKQGIKGKLSKAVSPATPEDGDTNIFVSVAYNPPAARHAISNKLFLQSTLNSYLKAGYTEIPNFPANSITVKPVYKVIPQNVSGGVYKFPGWPGTPSPAKTFPEKDWDSCVYLDIKGAGESGNSIDRGCKGQSKDSTFYLSDFIHQKISKQDANFLSTQLNIEVAEGDYAILVGMHVTTREIRRWTWQTYWWSADPAGPYLPSSKEIAGSRPLQSLDKAAQHYAMSVAYQMVSPAQPIMGGKNMGESVIGYNPHLEAGFDPSVFQIVRKINGTTENRYGVETNCMTCHNLALYNPATDYKVDNGANREKPYAADFYMGIADEVFDGTLKLDFAWSIIGNLKLDDPQ